MAFNDKNSQKSYITDKSTISGKSQGCYGNKKKQELKEQEILQKQILKQKFEENEQKMKKIRQEAKIKQKLKEQQALEQLNKEKQLQQIQKENKKKEQLKKIKKDVNPKKLQKNLQGLDLEVQNSILFHEKKQDNLFSGLYDKGNMDALDLSSSNLFINKMAKDQKILYNIDNSSQIFDEFIQKKQKDIKQQEQLQVNQKQINQPIEQNDKQNQQKNYNVNVQNIQQIEKKPLKQQNKFQPLDAQLDEIEEMIGYSSDEKLNTKRQQKELVRIDVKPPQQKKKKSLEKKIIKAQVLNSFMQNNTKYQFNEDEFLKADLLNINKEEYELQKQLNDLELQNQAQIQVVYEKNQIQKKYDSSNQVINDLNINVENKRKILNKEQDLEQSLFTLDQVLDKKRLLKNQNIQYQIQKQHESINDQFINLQPNNQQKQQIIQNQTMQNAQFNQKQKITIDNQDETQSQFTQMQNRQNKFPNDKQNQSVNQIIEYKLFQNISNQISVLNDKSHINKKQNKQDQNIQMFQMNFCENLGELKSNISTLSKFSQDQQSKKQEKSFTKNQKSYSQQHKQQIQQQKQEIKQNKQQKKVKEQETIEINKDDCNFKVNNKLKNLLFDVDELKDSLIEN